MSEAYFLPRSADEFTPTEHTGGAWSDTDLHVSPLVGLLVHHVQQTRGADDLVIGRVSVEILGALARGDIALTSRVVRPGRTIELWLTEASIGDRVVLSALTWWMATVATEHVAGNEHDTMPRPLDVAPYDAQSVWPGGYIRSLDLRRTPDSRPGRARAWVSSSHPLIEGVNVSPLASFTALVDTANGVAVRQSPTEWMYPNLDLSIHLFRQPSGPWIGFDTTVAFGPSGQGLTSTVLHDEAGAVGTAAQVLTVRPLR